MSERLLPIRVAPILVGSLVDQTIHCAWFRVESVGDGTYRLVVGQDAGDVTLNALEIGGSAL